MWQIFILLVIILGFILGRALYVVYFAFKLPKNNPKAFITKQKGKINQNIKQRITFVGDSITHGKVGTNYVDIIKEILGGDRFHYINAGINSELAYNVNQRIDEIVQCRPDIITILIGTNDARGTFDKKEGARQFRQQKLPQMPNIDFYEENLENLITKLKNITDAEIVLISIPTIGEDIEEPSYKIVKNFVQIIKNLSQKHQVSYIPFYEKVDSLLQKMNIKANKPFEKQLNLMIKAVAYKYFFKISYEKISEKIGFKFHIDYLHLNNDGAKILADLIISFIHENL